MNWSKLPVSKLLALSGIAVLVLVYLVFPDRQEITYSADDPFAIENALLLEENSNLDHSLKKYQFKADSLTHLITSKNQIIHSLKSEIDEKLNHINRLSTAELEQFFAGIKTDSLPH